MADQSKTAHALTAQADALKERTGEPEEEVTKHELIGEMLRESGDLFGTYLEHAPDGVYMSDLKGTILYGNRKSEEITGYRREELIGKNYFEALIIADSSAKKAIRLLQANTEGKSTGPDEFELVNKAGSVVFVEVTTRPMKYDGRDVVLGFLRDVTDRRRTEEALRESEEKYRTLVETATESIFIAQDGMIKFCNKNFYDVSGYAMEALSAMPFTDLIHPDDRQMVFDRYIERAEGGDVPSRYSFRFVDARGNTRWADMNVALVSWEGKPASLCFASDITDRKYAEEALRKSEEKFRHLFERAEEGILVVRGETIRFANPALERILGHPMGTITSEPFVTFIHPDDRDLLLDRHERRMRGESVATGYDFRVVASDGTVKWVTIHAQRIDWEGEPANLAFITDVTGRKRAEEALRQSEEKYRTFVENASDVVYWTDENGYITFVNAVGLRITGYEESEIIGKHFPELIRQDKRDDAIRFFGRQFAGRIENTYSEYPIIAKDGREIWLGQNARLMIRDDRVAGFQAVARDITEMRKAKEQIHQMAYHDALTGLPNRLLFSDRLGIALAQAGRHQQCVAVMMLDLDHFKDVNDTLGHGVGDHLLRAAGERLTASLRKSDTVARFGGDEFVLILLDLKGEADVLPVAQKIVESFRSPFLIDGHHLMLTASVGIAIYPHNGKDETDLLRNADIAMYQAKNAGRDRYLVFRGG